MLSFTGHSIASNQNIRFVNKQLLWIFYSIVFCQVLCLLLQCMHGQGGRGGVLHREGRTVARGGAEGDRDGAAQPHRHGLRHLLQHQPQQEGARHAQKEILVRILEKPFPSHVSPVTKSEA